MGKESKIVPIRKEAQHSCSIGGCDLPAAVSELGAQGWLHLCAKHFAEAMSGKVPGISPLSKCG